MKASQHSSGLVRSESNNICLTGHSDTLLYSIYRGNILILLASIAVILFCLFFADIILLFPLLIIPFYILYAIHFLNYTNIFDCMEPAVKDEAEKNTKPSSITFSQIEKSINEWERSKLFMKPDLTIAIVAMQISTNRTYLSNYLNTFKQKTFNEWINGLRIEEAKKMIAANKNITLDDLCEKIGYSDKSYFSKCFKKYTGMTAKLWKSMLD